MWSRAKILMVRGVVGAAVAMLGAGCSGDAPSTKGTATVSDPSTPVTPGPNRPPSPTPGSYAITGLVQEAGRPIPGVNVNAWVEEDGGFGYSWWWAHGQLHADTAGRYSISGLPSGVHVWLQAFQDGYDQQCAVSVPTVRGDTTVDIALVSRAVAAPTALSPPGLRSVSGLVVLGTSGGQQSAAGAFVDFEPIMDFPAAITHADGAGRFALCGLPVNDTIWLGASSGSHVGYVPVPPGQSNGVKIVLP